MSIEFNFSKYDIGGDGATANDNKLTGRERIMAMQDGWTIWDGFEKGDKAMRTDDVVNRLFTEERNNNKPLLNDTRADANADYLQWAMGNYNTKGVIEVKKQGDIAILKIQNQTDTFDYISTYTIKDNKDGTTAITCKDSYNQDEYVLIDNRAGKYMMLIQGDEYIRAEQNKKGTYQSLSDYAKQLNQRFKNKLKNLSNF